MKKKLLSILLAAAMIVSLCACGSKEEPAAENANGEESAAEEEISQEETSGETAEIEALEIRLAHANATNQPIHTACEEWAEKVSEASGGKIVISGLSGSSAWNSLLRHRKRFSSVRWSWPLPIRPCSVPWYRHIRYFPFRF